MNIKLRKDTKSHSKVAQSLQRIKSLYDCSWTYPTSSTLIIEPEQKHKNPLTLKLKQKAQQKTVLLTVP